jgi:nucleotide-binding universal stress UspA family protein
VFERVIVGVDEHTRGRDAVALAKRLVATNGALVLAHVVLGELSAVPGGGFEASERQRALELLGAARDEAKIDTELLLTRSPSPGRGLHELAELEHADLLVVGSTGRGLLGRVLIGDDTRDALNGAPCAVAIAPLGYAERQAPLSEIGVAYNGSPDSEHALAVARELAAETGARVSAFEAVSLPAYMFGGAAAPAAAPLGDVINASVDLARERIAALGDVEPHAAYGAVAEELALYGASVDLLVIGSRGYGPIGRLVHGSVSRQLARTARCPLVVLTRASCPAHPSANDDAATNGLVQTSTSPRSSA